MPPPFSAKAGSADVVHLPGPFEDGGIVCCQGTAFTGGNILRRLKTESGRVAKRTGAAQLMNGAMGLRCIFDNL